ncbi:methylated-DNA--[protein]-cysteine S-methyltransferase [Pelagicoccus mobilis]|uniref:methylated-DNA--[protein]-cysteine S-methyltransferase n=1 Tax=Pelagicoccus mobilis TaxID=415221 RepID=A0A934VUB5_9BACT|nr:methylated-DNA--[protein]-cysteine S-methyltransferase [Pelagicoccus mobilis]MBK1880369.1 methylated-DNA--[protein]-cysteine S-methyltransferase [Pelagicoccus mobilis]
MSDYERIASIIRFLEREQIEQPSLAALSEYAGLSRHHLHRLFSSWAGVTPKDFLQCLTAERAKELLLKGSSVLDTSYEVGLSGPGRLHDLCVNLEAATPGEIKSAGAGWDIVYGFAESPFGRFLAAESPRGICHLSFGDEGRETEAVAQLRGEWEAAAFSRDDSWANDLSTQIFSVSEAAKAKHPLRALVRGSEFQLLVWRALLRIPHGELVSYGALAEELDKPKAARAVGNAVGKNQLAYLIPCHRVIRETGVVGNYRWGSIRKRAMLVWEAGTRA